MLLSQQPRTVTTLTQAEGDQLPYHQSFPLAQTQEPLTAEAAAAAAAANGNNTHDALSQPQTQHSLMLLPSSATPRAVNLSRTARQSHFADLSPLELVSLSNDSAAERSLDDSLLSPLDEELSHPPSQPPLSPHSQQQQQHQQQQQQQHEVNEEEKEEEGGGAAPAETSLYTQANISSHPASARDEVAPSAAASSDGSPSRSHHQPSRLRHQQSRDQWRRSNEEKEVEKEEEEEDDPDQTQPMAAMRAPPPLPPHMRSPSPTHSPHVQSADEEQKQEKEDVQQPSSSQEADSQVAAAAAPLATSNTRVQHEGLYCIYVCSCV